jgi:hypothetical protein
MPESLGLNEANVAFLGRGGWNRTWSVTSTETSMEYVLRVSLPVHPFYKTSSEVGTMELVRQKTTIPLPTVYAYDPSAKNELGYEWILMSKAHGVSWETVLGLSVGQHKDIARAITDWMDQLSKITAPEICSYYLDANSGEIVTGRPVCQTLMLEWRHQYLHERGPFPDTHSYLRAYVECRGTELFDPRQQLHARLIKSIDTLAATLSVEEH